MATIAAVYFGHSHLAAMIPFLYNRELEHGEQGNAIEHYVFDIYNNRNIFNQDETKLPYGINENGRVYFNPSLLERVRARVQCDRKIVFISMFGGNSHNALTLLSSDRVYDFMLEGETDLPLDSRRELIPYDAVHAAIYRNTEAFLIDLEGLAGSVSEPVYHVLSPPTIEDDHLVSQIVTNDAILAQTGNSVTPAIIRYKSWQVHNRIFIEKCSQIGANVIYTPQDAISDGKWLATDCISSDATHGNVHFGGLIFKHIEKVLGGHFAGWDWIK
ncbi:hypothetical protein ACQZ6V_18755 [Agrobacterium sp. 22-3674b3]